MMKKLLTTMMACCALTCAEAQTNLSPEVNAYLSNYKKAEKTRSADAAKQTIVTLRLKPGAQPADVASRVEALGAEVKVTLGNQMTVALTGDILEKVAATEGVDIVEILSKATPRTDKSREVTQADKVISGTGLYRRRRDHCPYRRRLRLHPPRLQGRERKAAHQVGVSVWPEPDKWQEGCYRWQGD